MTDFGRKAAVVARGAYSCGSVVQSLPIATSAEATLPNGGTLKPAEISAVGSESALSANA
jgi:hypothetical protein